MLKFGISTISQLNDKSKLKNFLGSDKKISITLYPKVQEMTNADELAEKILLQFSDDRGAYKRTYQKRFELFDQTVLGFLKNNFNSTNLIELHDVAISDGRTALDFFQKLSNSFLMISYYASDYNPKLYIISKGKAKITLNQNDEVLEVNYPPFVFNKSKKENFLFYPLNYLCFFLINQFIVRPVLKYHFQGRIVPEEILLFAPQVLRLASKDNRFQLGQHNLIEPFDRRSDVIRAMNIFNLSYFTLDEFSKIVTNIYNSLKENGLLITGSNQNAGTLVHGGIYKKTTCGFEKIYQSGNGSPIDSIILKLKSISSL